VPKSNDGGLPLWARLTILGALLALLIYNVASKGDSALSLLIGGGLFAAIGIDQNARNRGGA
jgi:hypothetical protein